MSRAVTDTHTVSSSAIDPEDKEGLTKSGFNAKGFTDNNEGTLDQYCGMEQAFYYITLIIM